MMRYVFVATALILVLLGSRAASPQAPQTPRSAPAVAVPQVVGTTQYRSLLDQYCVGCHNQRAKTANLMFDTMDIADVAKHGDVWEKAIRKLRGGLMPPPGARQPDPAAVDSFISYLETTLDQAAAKEPNPGGI